MSSITVKFLWSEKARREHFNATGERLDTTGSVTFDVAQATPEQRAAMPLEEKLELYGRAKRTEFDSEPTIGDVIAILKQWAAEDSAEWDKSTTTHIQWDIEALSRAIANSSATPPNRHTSAGALDTADARGLRTAELRGLLAKYEELLPEFQRLAAERKARDEAAEEASKARREAEKARREAEKANWIEAHGSDHLRRAFAAGYDCQRKYVTERAAIEAPGFAVDFDDRAEWKNRACPSAAALDIEEAVDEGGIGSVFIVWLTHPTRELEYEDDFEACEAVVIRNYLGRYDLVKIV